MFNNDAIKLDDETFVRLQYTVLDILKMFKDDDALFRFIRYELSAASIGNDIAKELVEQSGFKSLNMMEHYSRTLIILIMFQHFLIAFFSLI